MTSNYPKRISLSNLTHMMNMASLVTISIETPTIDIGCFVYEDFIELIRMNH